MRRLDAFHGTVMEYSEAYRLYKDDVEIIGTAGAA